MPGSKSSGVFCRKRVFEEAKAEKETPEPDLPEGDPGVSE